MFSFKLVFIVSFIDIGVVLFVLVVSYLGVKGNWLKWIVIGSFLMVVGLFIFIILYVVFDLYEYVCKRFNIFFFKKKYSNNKICVYIVYVFCCFKECLNILII